MSYGVITISLFCGDPKVIRLPLQEKKWNLTGAASVTTKPTIATAANTKDTRGKYWTNAGEIATVPAKAFVSTTIRMMWRRQSTSTGFEPPPGCLTSCKHESTHRWLCGISYGIYHDHSDQSIGDDATRKPGLHSRCSIMKQPEPRRCSQFCRGWYCQELWTKYRFVASARIKARCELYDRKNILQ